MGAKTGIEVAVDTSTVRQNAARISDILTSHGAALTVVTKVLRLCPELVARTALTGYPLYDTDIDNCRTILQSGGRLLCAASLRDRLHGSGAAADSRVEAYATTFAELESVAGAVEPPTLYLDIDEGREGFLPTEYPHLAEALHAAGHHQIAVVGNARCDAGADPSAGFFAPLHQRLRELDELGITVGRVSLGGSALLANLDQLAELTQRINATVSVRVGESIVNGSIPSNDALSSHFGLQNALSVHLPIMQSRGADIYLVHCGYQSLDQSGIDGDKCTILRQWSEHTLLTYPADHVGDGHVQIPLSYRGAARLKVNRDVEMVFEPHD